MELQLRLPGDWPVGQHRHAPPEPASNDPGVGRDHAPGDRQGAGGARGAGPAGRETWQPVRVSGLLAAQIEA